MIIVKAENLPSAWETSIRILMEKGNKIQTQYDQPGSPPSMDDTAVIEISRPLSDPIMHRFMPGGIEALCEYVMEVREGIKDRLIRDPGDVESTLWEYTYHQRMRHYLASKPDLDFPENTTFLDQLDEVCQKLIDCPYTRRAQILIGSLPEDLSCDDPPCLRSMWFRVIEQEDGPSLQMNVTMRSNDAGQAAFMNMFAFAQLHKLVAKKVSDGLGMSLNVGPYIHMADSYHIYGKDIKHVKNFLIDSEREFKDRVWNYEDIAEIYESARDSIKIKAEEMIENARRQEPGRFWDKVLSQT